MKNSKEKKIAQKYGMKNSKLSYKGISSKIDKELKNIINAKSLNSDLKSKLNKLSKDISLVSKREKLFSNLINIDGLTGLYNHKYFYEVLDKEILRSERIKSPLSIIMLDIDHFKAYNDTYGHPQGDIVLKEIANLIKNNIRAYDIGARYGGEEFTIILPHTNRREGYEIIERLRRKVAEYPFYGEYSGKKEKVKITISAGIASFPVNATTKSSLINRVDKALYLAKEEGRNRVCASLITEKDIIRFAFCPPSLSEFFSNVLEGVREIAWDIGNVEVIIRTGSSELSYEEQLKMIDKAIEEKVPTMGIFSKIDLGNRIVRANKAGIKVFVFNITKIKMKPAGKIVSYIGYEHIEAGRKVGQYIAKILRGKGKVAILEGLPNEADSMGRKEGFVEALKDFPDIKVVASESADWERKKAGKVAKKILKKFPDIDTFFGVSDEMALGIVDTIIEMGKLGKIFIIGHDGNQNALQSIKRGELFATLSTNPIEMGRILMRTVLRSTIREEMILKRTKSPLVIVNSENVDRFLQ